ncbi:MAG: hypothetical protein OXH59_10015 [Rhodospirillaceae bacterium]|nr:hypothetical protein [Rhodospirillaceae bacterium]
MNAAKREARETARIETARAVAALERQGICWQSWARERGLDGQAVKEVCRGARATRGEAFRAAEAIRVEASRPGRHVRPLPGLPIAITDWDATWPMERVFQSVAIDLARRMAPAGLHVLDTSKLAIPDDYNARVAGAPGIVACRGGRYVAIELKSAKQKLTDPQKWESERTEIAGGIYVVARTMREVFEALGLEVPE